MVYRFLESDAGKVVAEDSAPGQHSFMNHYFPASDIPAQARALYVRNLVRVIPDVSYVPAPLTPPRPADAPLDMSDCSLRSVSPTHILYLTNMRVAASTSFSIVKDGFLWGLVACHNSEPRLLPLDIRAGGRALASALARQIKSRENTDAYRERVRLRTFEVASSSSCSGRGPSALRCPGSSRKCREFSRPMASPSYAPMKS